MNKVPEEPLINCDSDNWHTIKDYGANELIRRFF